MSMSAGRGNGRREEGGMLSGQVTLNTGRGIISPPSMVMEDTALPSQFMMLRSRRGMVMRKGVEAGVEGTGRARPAARMFTEIVRESRW